MGWFWLPWIGWMIELATRDQCSLAVAVLFIGLLIEAFQKQAESIEKLTERLSKLEER